LLSRAGLVDMPTLSRVGKPERLRPGRAGMAARRQLGVGPEIEELEIRSSPGVPLASA